MVNNLNDRINCETGELNPPIGMAEAGHEDSEEAATGGTAFTKEFGRGFKAGRETGRVALLEALRRCIPHLEWANRHGPHCGELIAEAEAAIQQAERT